MLKNIIKEFTQKNEGFDFNQFIFEFEAGLSRDKMCKKFEITEMVLRKFVYSLGLNFVKSKRLSSIKELHQKLALESGENLNLVDDLESELEKYVGKTEQLYKSLTLVRDENARLRKGLRKEARVDNLSEVLLTKFEHQLDSIIIQNTPYVLPNLTKAIQRDGLVLVLGDEHFGSVETQEVANNNFNYDVAKRRLEYMVDKTLANPLQSHNLKVVELLDVTQGLIHDSEYLSEGGYTTSLLKVVEVYSDIYSRLYQAYDKIEVYVTGDNHSRITQKPSSYMKWDNIGILTMKMVDMVLKAKGIKNVHFYFTKNEYHFLEINGTNILTFHSDTIRSYTPVSQGERAKLQAICLGIFGKPYKTAISGHIHKSNASMNEYGGYNISNGTLVGNGQYGNSNGFASINPSQTILYFDDIGDIEQLSFINLSHIQ